MAEKWHRAKKCLDCYYLRYLSSSTSKLQVKDPGDWDGKICHYSIDTELPRIGRGETCECHITIDEYLNNPNTALRRKIERMLKSKKSLDTIKRETSIPIKYIRDIAKKLGVVTVETDIMDELIKETTEDVDELSSETDSESVDEQ